MIVCHCGDSHESHCSKNESKVLNATLLFGYLSIMCTHIRTNTCTACPRALVGPDNPASGLGHLFSHRRALCCQRTNQLLVEHLKFAVRLSFHDKIPGFPEQHGMTAECPGPSPVSAWAGMWHGAGLILLPCDPETG